LLLGMENEMRSKCIYTPNWSTQVQHIFPSYDSRPNCVTGDQVIVVSDSKDLPVADIIPCDLLVNLRQKGSKSAQNYVDTGATF